MRRPSRPGFWSVQGGSAMFTTLDTGKKLVDLCKQGRNMEAIESLYDPKVVSIETHDNAEFPMRVEGIDGVRKKNDWWHRNHEVHKTEVTGPWPHGDRFIARFKYDVTGKSGPMAGKRM